MSDKLMVQHQLLDLLVDGPSSVAALFGGLRRHYRHDDLRVESLLRTLSEMAESGWIRWMRITDDGFREANSDDLREAMSEYPISLRTAEDGDYSVDEVGLWCEIVPSGRTEWTRWAEEGDDATVERWVLEERADGALITIDAENEELAERALNAWRSLNRDRQLLLRTKRIEPISAFRTQHGETVRNGVRLTCEYSRVSTQ